MVLFEPMLGWVVGAEDVSSEMYSVRRVCLRRRRSDASRGSEWDWGVGMVVGLMRGGR